MTASEMVDCPFLFVQNLRRAFGRARRVLFISAKLNSAAIVGKIILLLVATLLLLFARRLVSKAVNTPALLVGWSPFPVFSL